MAVVRVLVVSLVAALVISAGASQAAFVLGARGSTVDVDNDGTGDLMRSRSHPNVLSTPSPRPNRRGGTRPPSSRRRAQRIHDDTDADQGAVRQAVST